MMQAPFDYALCGAAEALSCVVLIFDVRFVDNDNFM